MNIQRALLSLVYSLGGIVLLSVCSSVFYQPRTAADDHLHLKNFVTLSIDNNGRYTLMIPVFNGADLASLPTELNVEIEYDTTTNGGVVNCNSDVAPKTPSCKPPVRCSETLVYHIPSLKANSRWNSPKSMIGPAVGECVCLRGQCEGSVTLRLSSPHDPNLEKLMNVSQLISWSITGDITHRGYKDDLPPE